MPERRTRLLLKSAYSAYANDAMHVTDISLQIPVGQSPQLVQTDLLNPTISAAVHQRKACGPVQAAQQTITAHLESAPETFAEIHLPHLRRELVFASSALWLIRTRRLRELWRMLSRRAKRLLLAAQLA